MTKVEVPAEMLEEIKKLIEEKKSVSYDSLDDLVGKSFFFRTVTYHLVGKIGKRLGKFFLLQDASWVADSGRFANAIKEGTLDEVEPVGTAMVNIDSITDMFPWNHKLPDSQK